MFIPEVHIRYGPKATAHSIATEHAAMRDLLSPQAVVSSVADCSVASESAAVFGYADGNEIGYRLSVVHRDYLYEVWLYGAAGVDEQALQEALGMIGSIAWAI
jgi:hypothetical protein